MEHALRRPLAVAVAAATAAAGTALLAPAASAAPKSPTAHHQLCDDLTGEDRGARDYSGFGRVMGNINLTGLDEMSDAAATALCTFARRDFDKQPLVDPKPRQEGVDGINEGGGLHADHDDHEPVAGSSCTTAAPSPPGGGAAVVPPGLSPAA